MGVWMGCMALILAEAFKDDHDHEGGKQPKDPLDIPDGLYYAVLLPLLLPTVAIYRFFVWVPVKFYQYN